MAEKSYKSKRRQVLRDFMRGALQSKTVKQDGGHVGILHTICTGSDTSPIKHDPI